MEHSNHSSHHKGHEHEHEHEHHAEELRKAREALKRSRHARYPPIASNRVHHGLPAGVALTDRGYLKVRHGDGMSGVKVSRKKCKKSPVNGHMLLRNKKNGRFCKKSKSRSRSR